MEEVKENLADSLNRLNFIFQNEIIVTECIKNSNGFSVLGESFGPFEESKKYKLKLFSAIHFIEKGILKVALIDKCDNIDVQRYAMEERDDPQLTKRINKFFLNKLREFKKLMKNEIEKNNKPKIDFDRYNSYTSNIIDARLSKLLKLSLTELSLDDERRLTNSEMIFYNYLYNLVKIWRDFF